MFLGAVAFGPASETAWNDSAQAAATLNAPAAQGQAPGWSRGQQLLAITYDECVRRAPAALQTEGYRIDYAAGAFAVGIKDVHTAVIMCNAAPEGKIWVNIVVASNGDGGGDQRQRLQARMEQPAQGGSAGGNPGGTGREGCQAADYSLRVEPGTVRTGQPVTFRFASRGRLRDRDWIAVYPAGKDAHSYTQWAYANDHTDTCSWTLAAPAPGQYEVAFLLDNGYDVMARASLTVVAGDMGLGQRVEPTGTSRYIGCFKDTSAFDLDGYLERSESNTPQRCVQTCAAKGFAYAGVQYGQSCLCGNSYGKYGSADNCNMKCTGDPGQICGGYAANSVYATGK